MAILSRPLVRVIHSLKFAQISVKTFSHRMNTGLFTGKGGMGEQEKDFPLESRMKTVSWSENTRFGRVAGVVVWCCVGIGGRRMAGSGEFWSGILGHSGG